MPKLDISSNHIMNMVVLMSEKLCDDRTRRMKVPMGLIIKVFVMNDLAWKYSMTKIELSYNIWSLACTIA